MDDLISRQWLMECVNEGWIKFDTEKDENRFIHLVRDIAPSAQPVEDIHREKEQAYYCGYEEGIKAGRSAQPGCEDAVPRTSVEYICRKNTVSTNPYEHKYHDKFIQFMDDPEISDFGRWQHSNGFNTALVAVKCDLDKVPSVTPKAYCPEGEEHGET